MNGNNIVADTSLLINFFNGIDIAKRVIEDRGMWFSCITEIELLSYHALTDDEEALIKSFLTQCNMADLITPIRETAIDMRKNLNLKVPDAIIAATAVYLDLPLVTMDSDFKNIEGLDTVILKI